ncbi:UNVERIFIED_CONTAM: Retrovirus-related Pol polyprotein from transposon RE2 [Sesamum indicum]
MLWTLRLQLWSKTALGASPHCPWNVTVHVFLVVAVAQAWPLHQLDINNAFLHRRLEEDIHMTPHEGYNVAPDLICKLQHSLYGLKQASHSPMSLLVYVDDILITGPSLADIKQVKAHLHALFPIKEIGDARYFIRLQITRGTKSLYVAETKYIMDILQDTGLSDAKATSTPLPPGLKLVTSSGALQPNPDALLDAALHVVRYLKGCPSRGLFFPSHNSFTLKAYCDVDWASCPNSRRSLTDFCVFLGDALVSWKTKPQSTVSRSTAEAEYRSLVATVCKLRWLSYILSDFSFPIRLPIDLFCDNMAALHILANLVFHERTTHIELDCHLVNDAYNEGVYFPFFRSKFASVSLCLHQDFAIEILLSAIVQVGPCSLRSQSHLWGTVELQQLDHEAVAAHQLPEGSAAITKHEDDEVTQFLDT